MVGAVPRAPGLQVRVGQAGFSWVSVRTVVMGANLLGDLP